MANLQPIFDGMGARFQADKAGDTVMKVQFDLSGDGGGQWHVTIDNGSFDVGEGPIEGADATLKMDANDFESMSNGDLNPMMAFMSGKIKVDGDLNTLMKFQNLVGF